MRVVVLLGRGRLHGGVRVLRTLLRSVRDLPEDLRLQLLYLLLLLFLTGLVPIRAIVILFRLELLVGVVRLESLLVHHCREHS